MQGRSLAQLFIMGIVTKKRINHSAITLFRISIPIMMKLSYGPEPSSSPLWLYTTHRVTAAIFFTKNKKFKTIEVIKVFFIFHSIFYYIYIFWIFQKSRLCNWRHLNLAALWNVNKARDPWKKSESLKNKDVNNEFGRFWKWSYRE